MGVKEQIWNDLVYAIEHEVKHKLKHPLQDYFYVIGNIIIFDLKKKLDDETEYLLSFIFKSIFDD